MRSLAHVSGIDLRGAVWPLCAEAWISQHHVAEKPSAVIPGRRKAAGPESRKVGNPSVLDSGFAPKRVEDARERA